ncbi:MAG: hypothetical protein Sapg2KO_12710 [Saprospiraceae bacterium]
MVLCLLTFCLSCQRYSNAKTSTLYQQATEIEALVAPVLKEMEQEKNSLSIQGRALTETELQKIDQIDTLLNRYDWFQKNHQATQSIKIQKECLETIQWIQKQLSEMKS